jgi:hypothetical protein
MLTLILFLEKGLEQIPVKMKLQKVGTHPEDLEEVSSNKLILLLSDRFTCCGKVVRWDYYRKTPMVPLYASVWRHQEANKYTLIDYNELLPGVIDFQAREISDDEQIEVQAGDIIGAFYSRYSISGAVAMRSSSDTNSDSVEESKDGVSENKSSTTDRVVEVDVWEEDLSPGDTIDLDSVPHTYSNVKLAIQANLKVSEKQ